MVIIVEEIADNRARIAAAASGGVRDLTALIGHTIYVSPICGALSDCLSSCRVSPAETRSAGWSAVKCLRQSEAPGRRGATGCSQIRGARARGAIKRQQAASATNVTSKLHRKFATRGQAAILWRHSHAFALHMGGKQSLHVPLPSSSSSTDYTHRPRKTYRNSSVSWQQHQNTTQCIESVWAGFR